MDEVQYIVRSMKTKLYPTKKQESIIEQNFRAVRFVFNQLLGQIKDFKFGSYDKDPSRPLIPSQTILGNALTPLKKTNLWLYQTGNDYLQASVANLYSAFKNFYRGAGYPDFKRRKDSKQSFNMQAGVRVKIKDNRILINGTKEWVKFSKHKEFPLDHKITGFTISRDYCGQYWLSVTYKYPNLTPSRGLLNPIGCDLGLKETLICSDGTVYPRIHLTKKYEKKLTMQQRSLSRKKIGSKNRDKARLKVAKTHDKIAKIRKHNNHNISRSIVNKSNLVVLESLDVKQMMQNKSLSKSIADVAWSQLTTYIGYKLAESQGQLIKIDKWFPSSKTCSKCGTVKKELKLSERTFCCTECGFEADRDFNASLNILAEGIKSQELLRNNQELSKITSMESIINPASLVQDIEVERNSLTSLCKRVYNFIHSI